MTVWITQLLCPQRHAITASAGEAETQHEAELLVERRMRSTMRRWLREKVISPHCAICGANAATWRYETRRTVYQTLEEAEPELRLEEAKQAVTNAVFGDLHLRGKPN